MKKYILLSSVFLSGILMSMGGCGPNADYYKLTDIEFLYGSPDDIDQDHFVYGDTLVMLLTLHPDYIATTKIKGFETGAYALTTHYGQLGFKDKLQSIQITSTTSINGIPAGNDLIDQVEFAEQSGNIILSKDTVIHLLNNGALSSDDFSIVDPLRINIAGPPSDSLLKFMIEFHFEHSVFADSTDLIIWNP